jgi:hypothetical protein
MSKDSNQIAKKAPSDGTTAGIADDDENALRAERAAQVRKADEHSKKGLDTLHGAQMHTKIKY